MTEQGDEIIRNMHHIINIVIYQRTYITKLQVLMGYLILKIKNKLVHNVKVQYISGNRN